MPGTQYTGKAGQFAVMAELGIDISGHRSKGMDEFAGQHFDYVLTVCDNSKESCPIFPGPSVRIHHTFDDPAELQGSMKNGLPSSVAFVTSYEGTSFTFLWMRETGFEGLVPFQRTTCWKYVGRPFLVSRRISTIP